MESLPVQELPPIIYQLLLLASKGHHSFILTGITNLFDQLNQENMDTNEREDEFEE